MSSWLVTGALAVFAVALVLSRVKAPPQPPASPEERSRLEHQLRLCLAAGRKLEAIKLYRRLHGTDLKSSKAAVESLLLRGALE
ncbi:MAG: hypothetical protein ABFS41_00375 [Myxococcota bacterium]